MYIKIIAFRHISKRAQYQSKNVNIKATNSNNHAFYITLNAV